MATCPKCGVKLRLTQWRPECPACGVNMVYYKANDRLLEETEKAEIEHALFQPKIDRAKASFFGSPQAIARVVLTLLPIGALFLPLVRSDTGESNTASVLQVFGFIKDLGFQTLISRGFGGDPIAASVLLLLFSVVMLLVCLICIVMSLGKYGKLRNLILNLLLLGSAAASAWLIYKNGDVSAYEALNANTISLYFGAYVYLGLLSLILIYNLILAKTGLKIKHTPCFIGGPPSETYFAMVEHGESDLTIRKKMVEALTEMQDKIRVQAAEDEKKAAEERAARK